MMRQTERETTTARETKLDNTAVGTIRGDTLEQRMRATRMTRGRGCVCLGARGGTQTVQARYHSPDDNHAAMGPWYDSPVNTPNRREQH